MTTLTSIQEELKNTITSKRLQEIKQWAFLNGQTDVYNRVDHLLTSQPAKRYNLGLGRPFLNTASLGLASPIDMSCSDASKELATKGTSTAGQVLNGCKNPISEEEYEKRNTDNGKKGENTNSEPDFEELAKTAAAPKKKERKIDGFPDFSNPKTYENDLDYETLRNSRYWISFFPDKGAKSEINSWIELMPSIYNELKKEAENQDFSIDELNIQFSQFYKGMLKRKNAVVSARSKTASTVITGPANFPTRKAQAASSRYHDVTGEYYKYQDYKLRKIRSKIYKTEGIKSGEVDTLIRLQEKLQDLQRFHNMALQANKALRVILKKDGDFDSKMETYKSELSSIGFTEKDIKSATNLAERDKKWVYASFYTTSSGTKIRELKKRIEREKKRLIKYADGSKETEIDGLKIVENVEANRLQLIFDVKPDDNIRKILKSNGFRWSPRFTAWQRQLTNNALYSLKVYVLPKLKENERNGLASPFFENKNLYNAFDTFDPLELRPGLAKPSTLNLSDLYETINNKILKAIDNNVPMPWNSVKPWTTPDSKKTDSIADHTMYLSYATNKPYSILNQMLISDQLEDIVEFPFLITENTVKRLGGKLKKTARPVIIYVAGAMWVFNDKDNDVIFYSLTLMREWLETNLGLSGDALEDMLNACFRRFLTSHIAYPTDDVEGIDFNFKDRGYIPGRVNQWENAVDAADAIVQNLPKPKAGISHKKQDRAFYRRDIDMISMPLKSQFKNTAGYYSTLLHEIIHSTGAKNRLKRTFGLKQFDANYNKEELVAEIGASYLTAEAGILNDHIEHTADYLKSFIKGLKKQIGDDPETLVTAFGNAQRAAEYVLQRNTNGTPKYVDELLEKQKKQAKVYEDVFGDDPKKTTPKKTTPSKNPKPKPDPVAVEIKKIKTRENGTLKSRQLELFNQLGGDGLASPNDVVWNRFKFQNYVLKTKYGNPTKKKSVYLGDVSGPLKDLTKATTIVMPGSIIKKEVETYPGGAQFYNLMDLLKSITTSNDIKKTGKKITVFMDMINFSGGTYKAMVTLKEVRSTLEVVTFESKITRSKYRELSSGKKTTAKPKSKPAKKTRAKTAALASPLDRLYRNNNAVDDDTTNEPTIDLVPVKPLNKLEQLKQANTVSSETQGDIFRLPGEIGKHLQELQRYRLAMVLLGESGAGKTEYLAQLMDAFLKIGDRLAYFSLEQGGLISKETRGAFNRNVTNYESLMESGQLIILDEAVNGIETVRQFAATGEVDVIAIDSFTELDVESKEFNNLRKDFPNVVFLIIFQERGDGQIRGGNKPVYDAPTRIRCYKGEDKFDFSQNYAQIEKNRGNPIGLQYSMASRSLISELPESDNRNDTITQEPRQVSQSSWSNAPLVI